VFSKLLYPPGSTSIFSNFSVMLILAILFSILTYEFIEKPLRKKNETKIIYILFLIMVAIGALSLVISFLPQKFSVLAHKGSI
jgi:peptidoglycan/LPS O-acetylase OafA/YrhL